MPKAKDRTNSHTFDSGSLTHWRNHLITQTRILIELANRIMIFIIYKALYNKIQATQCIIKKIILKLLIKHFK